MSHKDDIKKLITEAQRRLQRLKEQTARFGISTPPEILNEIEDIETEIEQLQRELATVEDADGSEAFEEGLSELAEDIVPKHRVQKIYLPPKTYHHFVGRRDTLDKIMGALRIPDHKQTIAVVGLGGIGKTALARDVAERCLQENLFDHIVWTSFKTEFFVSEDIVKTDTASYDFNELLSEIGRQCDQPDIIRLLPEQKRQAVKHLLSIKRVLVVMDNLDTVPNKNKLVNEIFQILGKSKCLIASRHRLKHEHVFTLDLGGFPEDEGVTFLRENSKERGIEVVTQAPRSQLIEINQVTGGAPLAMKLVIGQMSRQPMKVVLNKLKEATFKGQDYRFYLFVYQYSWEMLDMNARKALVDMSVFPPITGGAVADVQAVSQVEPSVFWEAMDQLVTLSLVDKTGEADQERYALHPLTQYFVRSDITKEWVDQ